MPALTFTDRARFEWRSISRAPFLSDWKKCKREEATPLFTVRFIPLKPQCDTLARIDSSATLHTNAIANLGVWRELI